MRAFRAIALLLLMSLPASGESTTQPGIEILRADLLERVPQNLRFERRPLAESSNAWPLWEKAFARFQQAPAPDSELAAEALDASKPFRLADVEAEVARFEATLKPFDEGIARRQVQFPVFDLDSDLSVAAVRGVSRLKLLRGLAAAERGKFDAAAGDLIGVFRAGEMTTRGDGPLIHYLIGLSVSHMALQAMTRIAGKAHAPPETIEEFIEALADAPDPRDTFADATRVELSEYSVRMAAALAVGQRKPAVDALMARGILFQEEHRLDQADAKRAVSWIDAQAEELGVTLFDGPATVQRLVEVTAGGLQAERTTPERVAEWNRKGDELVQPLDRVLSIWRDAKGGYPTPAQQERLRKDLPDVLGRYMAGCAIKGLPLVHGVVERHRATCALVVTALALRQYELKHNRLPETLGALVKDGILEALPSDPIGDGELHYDAARRVVWSVGPDGKDDGGNDKPGQTLPDTKDFVWTIPGAVEAR